MLLDMVMPGGKVLGLCTRADLRMSSDWQARLARQLRGRQEVWQVFTECGLRYVWSDY